MRVINIPKLGTVIWDKTLDYPKLLKQVVDLESDNETLYDSQQSLLTCNAVLKNKVKEEQEKCKKLYEDNQKLHSQLEQANKEINLFWLGFACIFIGNLAINLIN